jgi:hypothetical protein
VWSIKAQDTVEVVEEHGNKILNADLIPNARFVFVIGSQFAALHGDNAKTCMDDKT